LKFHHQPAAAPAPGASARSGFPPGGAAVKPPNLPPPVPGPTEKTPPPTSCTEAASPSSVCPSPASINAQAGYPAAGTCPGTEPWGSSLSNRWTTYVRSDTNNAQLFNSTTAKGNSPYDNGDRSVWVRPVGVSQCKR